MSAEKLSLMIEIDPPLVEFPVKEGTDLVAFLEPNYQALMKELLDLRMTSLQDAEDDAAERMRAQQLLAALGVMAQIFHWNREKRETAKSSSCCSAPAAAQQEATMSIEDAVRASLVPFCHPNPSTTVHVINSSVEVVDLHNGQFSVVAYVNGRQVAGYGSGTRAWAEELAWRHAYNDCTKCSSSEEWRRTFRRRGK